MVTQIDYAALSALVYNNARGKFNSLTIPAVEGWSSIATPTNPSGGFTAEAYRNGNGNDIVIAFKGTDTANVYDLALDMATNRTLGLGGASDQLKQAALFYAKIKTDPQFQGCNISFTSHSLGGGLVTLMAVYFDKPATTFAPAPFMLSALNMATLGAYQIAIAELGKTDIAFNAYTSNPAALYAARQANVEAHTINGEVLINLFGRSSTIVDPAKDYLYAAGHSISPTDLYSILLHAAVIRSPEFKLAITNVLSVLPTIIDKRLYATDAQLLNKLDFMHKLMQQELTWPGFDSHTPLRRFADDLLVLASGTGGTVQRPDFEAAMATAAIEYRYYEDASATQLLTSDSYGLHFKYSDIGASSYKSMPKLAAAVNALLTSDETALLSGKLIKQDVWHIQSGLGRLILNATGADNDAVIGGAISDGIFAGDGTDTILDSDGSGSIVVGGLTLSGGALVDGTPNVWKNKDQGITYTLKGSGASQVLLISKNGSSDGILVQGLDDMEWRLAA